MEQTFHQRNIAVMAPRERCPMLFFTKDMQIKAGGRGSIPIRTTLNNFIKQNHLVYKVMGGKIVQTTLKSKLYLTQSGMY